MGAVSAELPESSIYRSFKWSYKNWEFTWEIRIPVSHYFGYAMIPLEERRSLGYDMMVTHDDPIIQSLASVLIKKAKELGFNEYDTANFILTFVQDHYLKDDEMTPYDEYPKFPIETLVEGGGDCEDSSIFYAALMRAAGYDVVLISLPRHMAVGVALSQQIPGSYVRYNGKNYYYAETTGSGWLLGMVPDAYKNQKVKVIEIPQNPEGTQLKLQKIIEEIAYTPERCKAVEEKYMETSEEILNLVKKVSELEMENSRLKSEINRLNFDIQKLNFTINKLKPRAELADKIIEFVPLVVMILMIIIAITAIVAYYGGKSAAKKEIFGT